MAGHTGEDAEFTENDDVGASNEAVVDDLGVPAILRGIALDVEDDIFFVFGAGGVFQSDQQFARIKVDTQLMRPAGATNSEIAKQSFFAYERFFAGDLIPLLAFFEYNGSDTLPNDAAQTDGGFVV